MPFIKANDIRLYYKQQGKGAPLILIAGYSADHTVWQHMVAPLSEYFTVITFDNRGAGQTDAPASAYTLEQMAQDTVALMAALKIEKAHMMGHSMGGKILQALANQANRVNKLILLTPA